LQGVGLYNLGRTILAKNCGNGDREKATVTALEAPRSPGRQKMRKIMLGVAIVFMAAAASPAVAGDRGWHGGGGGWHGNGGGWHGHNNGGWIGPGLALGLGLGVLGGALLAPPPVYDAPPPAYYPPPTYYAPPPAYYPPPLGYYAQPGYYAPPGYYR
jgi:hypothetical protein